MTGSRRNGSRSTWDYVVVGGGTAGCLVASRLAEDPQTRVLLIEAGGRYPDVPLSIPLLGLRVNGHFSWKYRSVPQPALSGRQIDFPFGRVLGGSSAVNAMMYVRGDPRCYDRWQDTGNEGWSFADVLPYFRKAEHYERGPSTHHGVHGPVHVSDAVHVAPFSRAFVAACLELGFPATDDFNGPQTEGAGLFHVMQSDGRRATTAHLPARCSSARLTVTTRSLVRRVLFDGQRAAGVEYGTPGAQRQIAWAEREVILSAGTFNSPKLLMLSGVGPADHLRQLGIPLVADLPGVGGNLQDHVRIPVLYGSGRRSPARPTQWVQAGLAYGLRRRGVLASNCCESGLRLRSARDVDCVDLQLVTHFQTALARRAVDLEVCLFQTASRGSIRLASADPAVPPAIDPRYLSADADVRLALQGVRLARRLAGTDALRRFPLTREIQPGAHLESDPELEQYIRSAATTSFHPAGSCRMGKDRMAVVDSRLHVRGLDGLRVIDASIMPELPNGHTTAPTLMIAERGADLLRA